MAQRKITTIQELDALPNRTIVLTRWENPVQIDREVQTDPTWWHWVIMDGGPCNVLWEPAQ